jgi:hypothetical protein
MKGPNPRWTRDELEESWSALRAENERLRAALEVIEGDGCETYSYADCCTRKCVNIARAALSESEETKG